MRVLGVSVLAAMAIAVGSGPAVARIDCEPARCSQEIQDAINGCPCPDASNHGRYVSCVAHAVKAVADAGTIPKNCKGKVVRCAARSTCGKPGFVVCKIPVYGTCDLSTSLCSEGTSVLLDGTCAADTDCVVTTKCKIKSSEQRCLDRGGTADPNSTTCCAACQ
jgi:hypothetical protein